ncbi:MAG: hypothetical protein AVDCRST_MAG19-4319, partial [uncultured Thermomicrobiales bacterium]
ATPDRSGGSAPDDSRGGHRPADTAAVRTTDRPPRAESALRSVPGARPAVPRLRLDRRRRGDGDHHGHLRGAVPLRRRAEAGRRGVRLEPFGADRRGDGLDGRSLPLPAGRRAAGRPRRRQADPGRRHRRHRLRAAPALVRRTALAGLSALRRGDRGRPRRRQPRRCHRARWPLVRAAAGDGAGDRHLGRRLRSTPDRSPRRLDADRRRLADDVPAPRRDPPRRDGPARVAGAPRRPRRLDAGGAVRGGGRDGPAGGGPNGKLLAAGLGLPCLRLHDGLPQHPLHRLRRRHGDGADARRQRRWRHRRLQHRRQPAARDGCRSAPPGRGARRHLRPARRRLRAAARPAARRRHALRLRRRPRRLLDGDHPTHRRHRRRHLRPSAPRRDLRQPLHLHEHRLRDRGGPRRRRLRAVGRLRGGAGGQCRPRRGGCGRGLDGRRPAPSQRPRRWPCLRPETGPRRRL